MDFQLSALLKVLPYLYRHTLHNGVEFAIVDRFRDRSEGINDGIDVFAMDRPLTFCQLHRLPRVKNG